jgi:hypothetical protein
MSQAMGDCTIEEFVGLAWETTLFALIGEELDPAECVAGAWLESRSRGGRGAAVDMQLWFAVRDDKTCKAICKRLISLLNARAQEAFEKAGGARFGGSRAITFPGFTKHAYYWDGRLIAAGDKGSGNPWPQGGAPRNLGKHL